MMVSSVDQPQPACEVHKEHITTNGRHPKKARADVVNSKYTVRAVVRPVQSHKRHGLRSGTQ